ncbi:MAG: hypothetical protein ALAOOOJD_03153 [bacterium]|nr:hypothetical protein [bacterium]
MEKSRQIFGARDEPHAFAAAAGRSFDQHWKADAFRNRQRFLWLCHGVFAAGHGGNAGALHELARRGFVAHLAHRLAVRANEDQPRRVDRIGESRIFRKKAVPGMNGLRAAALRRRNNFFLHQIRFPRRRRADLVSFIGHAHMHGEPVRLRINRDGANAHLTTGAHHAHGNFPAIGNEDFFKHSL